MGERVNIISFSIPTSPRHLSVVSGVDKQAVTARPEKRRQRQGATTHDEIHTESDTKSGQKMHSVWTGIKS